MNFDALILIVVAALVVHLLTMKKGKAGRSGSRRRGLSLFPRKKRSKASWYWGNKRWNTIRAFRKRENTERYGLKPGTCRCERCGDICRGKNVHCDHVWPRKPYWFLQYFYWNTQILCGTCNIKKSNKPGHNWRRMRQFGLHPLVWVLRWRQHHKGLR